MASTTRYDNSIHGAQIVKGDLRNLTLSASLLEVQFLAGQRAISERFLQVAGSGPTPDHEPC